MRVIAWASEKGGTGKTTSAINSAVAFAKDGNRTLLIDLDPQANATLVLTGGQGGASPTVADVLLGQAAAAAIRPTPVPGLDLLPAAVDLADAAVELTNAIGREARLRAALDGLAYALAVIDTPPTRSLLTINALVAADEVMIPVEPSLFAIQGLGSLQAAVEDVRRYLGNTGLRVGGVLLTRARNDNVSRDVEAQLRAALGPLVFATTVPASIRVEEAHGRYQSVIDFAPRSPGARAYLSLATEILSHGRHAHAAEDGPGTTPQRDLPPDRPPGPRGRRAAG